MMVADSSSSPIGDTSVAGHIKDSAYRSGEVALGGPYSCETKSLANGIFVSISQSRGSSLYLIALKIHRRRDGYHGEATMVQYADFPAYAGELYVESKAISVDLEVEEYHEKPSKTAVNSGKFVIEFDIGTISGSYFSVGDSA